MKTKATDEKLVYASTLKKEHGFTDRTIRLLGAPDKRVLNQHHLSGSMCRLYSLDRVMAFKRDQPELFNGVERQPRRDAAAKAVATKQAKMKAILDANPIKLARPMPATYEELAQIAQQHVNDRYGGETTPGYGGVVATVRHEFTNYEELLQLIGHATGSKAAYDSIRDTCDSEIEQWLFEAYEVTPDPVYEAAKLGRM